MVIQPAADRLPGFPPPSAEAPTTLRFSDLLASLDSASPPGKMEPARTFAFRDLGVFGLGRSVGEAALLWISDRDGETAATATPTLSAPAPYPSGSPEIAHESSQTISSVMTAARRPAPPSFIPAQTVWSPAPPAVIPAVPLRAPAGEAPAPLNARPPLPQATRSGSFESSSAPQPGAVETMAIMPEVVSSAEPQTPEPPATPDTLQPARRSQPPRELAHNPLALFEDAGRAGLAVQGMPLSPSEFQAFRRRAEALLEDYGLALIRLSHNGKTQSKVPSQGEGGASWR